jgi:hypothetical protein
MSIKIIKTACLHRLELENQCLSWVTVTVTYKKNERSTVLFLIVVHE